MAPSTYEVRGAVTFPANGEPREYEYSVSVVDEKLHIWVQDTVTYDEWQTTALGIADFVTIDTAIPQARIKDYATHITSCLTHTAEEAKLRRSLSKPAPDNSRILFVSLALQIMEFTTALEYTFHLFPVPIDPMKRLNAENERLKTHIATLTSANEALATKVDELTHQVTTLKAQEFNVEKPVERYIEAEEREHREHAQPVQRFDGIMPADGSNPPPMDRLTTAMLAGASPEVQRNMIGERLYVLVYRHKPELAGRITGMLLKRNDSELLHLLESPKDLESQIQGVLKALDKTYVRIDHTLYVEK